MQRCRLIFCTTHRCSHFHLAGSRSVACYVTLGGWRIKARCEKSNFSHNRNQLRTATTKPACCVTMFVASKSQESSVKNYQRGALRHCGHDLVTGWSHTKQKGLRVNVSPWYVWRALAGIEPATFGFGGRFLPSQSIFSTTGMNQKKTYKTKD